MTEQRLNLISLLAWACIAIGTSLAVFGGVLPHAEGYRGIWYMNQPSNDEYVYKYSGGLGTYCAKHKPFAIYRPEVEKTFFCYGGTTTDSHRTLLHMVSYYDHRTGKVPHPRILLDKKTDDAHDNPVISIDGTGFIWIFSTSHGTSRPSYIHRSTRPYNIDEFELIPATRLNGSQRVPIDNFSYMQIWPDGLNGFHAFFTRYAFPAARTICFMSSTDGIQWSEWQRLAAVGQGHYQISASALGKSGSAFNYHPRETGLNWRSNLYYIETQNGGKSWHAADGTALSLPLSEVQNPALIHNYEAENLKVYLKDIQFDSEKRPIILFLTSRGFESGPDNDPRIWRTARWTGRDWEILSAMRSDNNYDMGSLYLEDRGLWRIIAPTESGPQPYNPGGEVAMWISENQGTHWRKVKDLTSKSPRNHTYIRRPVNAHPEFYAFWADGHGREPSESRLYFCSREGAVSVLPREMSNPFETPAHLGHPEAPRSQDGVEEQR